MSKAARIAWPFIQRAAREGLGSEAIIELMREQAIPTFRRTDMLALIREASGAELVKSDIARWPKDVTLPFNRIRPSLTKIVAPFSYTLRVHATDAEGNSVTRLYQAHSQTLRPLAAVAEGFLSKAQAGGLYNELDVESAEVIDVLQAGPEGSL